MYKIRSLVGVLLAAILLAGCGRSDHIHLRINLAGPAGMDAAGRITERYIREQHFVHVVFPGLEDPTEDQILLALETAVVQPAIGGGGIDGPAFMACTVHDPSFRRRRELLSRCENELYKIAKALGIVLTEA